MALQRGKKLYSLISSLMYHTAVCFYAIKYVYSRVQIRYVRQQYRSWPT